MASAGRKRKRENPRSRHRETSADSRSRTGGCSRHLPATSGTRKASGPGSPTAGKHLAAAPRASEAHAAASASPAPGRLLARGPFPEHLPLMAAPGRVPRKALPRRQPLRPDRPPPSEASLSAARAWVRAALPPEAIPLVVPRARARWAVQRLPASRGLESTPSGGPVPLRRTRRPIPSARGRTEPRRGPAVRAVVSAAGSHPQEKTRRPHRPACPRHYVLRNGCKGVAWSGSPPFFYAMLCIIG